MRDGKAARTERSIVHRQLSQSTQLVHIAPHYPPNARLLLDHPHADFLRCDALGVAAFQFGEYGASF